MKYIVKKTDFFYETNCPFYREFDSYPTQCLALPPEVGHPASCVHVGSKRCPLTKEDIVVSYEGRKK